MSGSRIHFLIAGDAHFFATMKACMERINRFHPDAMIHLYDWGLETAQAGALAQTIANLEITDWKARIAGLRKSAETREDVPLDAVHLELAKRHVVKFAKGFRKRLMKASVKRLPRSPLAKKAVRLAIFYEDLLTEKIRCMMDASQSIGDEPLVFLDADIVLLDTIDDLFEKPFDVALSLIREEDFSDDDGFCLCINSGAVFFAADAGKRRAFLELWLAEAEAHTGYLSEQAALSIILEKGGVGRPRPDTIREAAIGEARYRVFLAPADVYNCFYFFKAESLDELDAVRIVHFIGDTFHKEQHAHLVAGLLAR